jgi:hypothetical protein
MAKFKDGQCGIKALRKKLDIVEAEKSLSLIMRENFDYTEWQRDKWSLLFCDS